MLIADFDNLAHTKVQILPLFHNIAPRCPNGRPVARAKRKGIAECLFIFFVQKGVKMLFHVVRVGCALGVDVKHNKAVKPVKQRNALGGFERVIQIVRRGGRGVNAVANQRIFAPRAEYVTVFVIVVRHKQPAVHVVIRILQKRILKRRVKHFNFERPGFTFRNVHIFPPCIRQTNLSNFVYCIIEPPLYATKDQKKPYD